MQMDHMRVENLKMAKKMYTQDLRGKTYFECKQVTVTLRNNAIYK